MTVEDQAVPVEDQAAPPESEEQAGSESGESAPQPTAREQELERRLRRQGQQLADLARTNQQLSTDLTRINSTVSTLTENLTAQQRAADEQRQRDTQAYLDSLPEPQRLKEEVRLANERVARLEGVLRTGTGASTRTPAASPQQAQESPEQYFRRRSNEIIAEAAETHGVTITREHLEAFDESDFNDERSFTRAVNRLAVRLENGEEPVADSKKKTTPPKAETPAEMEARITENVKRSLGVASPAAPRASGAAGRRGQAPTAEEIRETVNTYDSRRGPKANIEKLREQRKQLG